MARLPNLPLRLLCQLLLHRHRRLPSQHLVANPQRRARRHLRMLLQRHRLRNRVRAQPQGHESRRDGAVPVQHGAGDGAGRGAYARDRGSVSDLGVGGLGDRAGGADGDFLLEL